MTRKRDVYLKKLMQRMGERYKVRRVLVQVISLATLSSIDF